MNMKFLIFVALFVIGLQAKAKTIFENPRQVVMGQIHTCVLDDKGVACWGQGKQGQNDVPAGLKNVKSLSAGGFFTCALGTDVQCWGTQMETKVPPLKNPRFLATGMYTACAIDDEGMKCWTADDVLTGGDPKSPFPAGLTGIEQVAIGRENGCVIKTDKSVRCFDKEIETPVGVVLKNPKRVMTNSVYNCAEDDDGLKCWSDDPARNPTPPTFKNLRAYHVSLSGEETNGVACGYDDDGFKCWGGYDPRLMMADAMAIIPKNFIKGMKQFAFNANTACAIDDDGLKCWGARRTFDRLNVPQIRSKEVKSFTSGYDYGCALLDDDKITCWGTLEGPRNRVDANFPGDLKKIRQLAGGFSTACALHSIGVTCIGSPGIMNVPPLIQPSEIAVGEYYACAIDEDFVKCWGNLGSQSGPLSLKFKHPHMLTVGLRHSCVVDDDGVWCWGDNGYGQLKVPAQLSSAAQLVASESTSCAVDPYGLLMCWGQSTFSSVFVGTSATISLAMSGGVLITQPQGSVRCYGEKGFETCSAFISKLKNPRLFSHIGQSLNQELCALDGNTISCDGNENKRVPKDLLK